MAYSSNPNLPKARAFAMQLLIVKQLHVQIVANRCGVHRSTVYRWKRKWDVLNQHVQMDNPNRPSRAYSRTNHLTAVSGVFQHLLLGRTRARAHSAKSLLRWCLPYGHSSSAVPRWCGTTS